LDRWFADFISVFFPAPRATTHRHPQAQSYLTKSAGPRLTIDSRASELLPTIKLRDAACIQYRSHISTPSRRSCWRFRGTSKATWIRSMVTGRAHFAFGLAAARASTEAFNTFLGSVGQEWHLGDCAVLAGSGPGQQPQ
jgi:hypothetical protein